MCAKKGEVDKMPWELISRPHLSGGPGRLITYKLKSEGVKLWVLVRECSWRRGCPTYGGPELTWELGSLEKLKGVEGCWNEGVGYRGSMEGQERRKGSWGQTQKGLLGPAKDWGCCPEDNGKPLRVGSQVA